MHGRLITKHLPRGVIIPALPENDSSITTNNDNVVRRQAQLGRYLNRLTRNKILSVDTEFLMFLELPREFPRMKDSSWRSLLSAPVVNTQEDDWFTMYQVSSVILIA